MLKNFHLFSKSVLGMIASLCGEAFISIQDDGRREWEDSGQAYCGSASGVFDDVDIGAIRN